MKKCSLEIRALKPFGARFQMHYSALVVSALLFAGSLDKPVLGAITMFFYLAIIIVHEIGHGWLAHRMGLQVTEIEIGIMHGRCRYHGDVSEKDEALIAWGGALAQLAVAIPVLALDYFTNIGSYPAGASAVVFLGYFNLMTALFNLVPSPPLDGALAWRYFKHAKATARTRPVVRTPELRRIK